MAVAHILFNDQTTHGRLLRRALTQLEDGKDTLGELIATIQLMIDGDGSDPSQFSYVAVRFGFDDTAHAKSAWDELNSLYFKLNTNSQISDVQAAMNQAFAKFR